MVRSCQAEEYIQDAFGALVQQRAPIQVGLLVGKQGVGSRDLLLGTIRTPVQDGQDAAQATDIGSSSAGAKSASQKGKAAGTSTVAGPSNVQLDVEWISEHARQVARMLPGGLAVMGFYLFSTEPGFQSAVLQLCAALETLWGISAPPPDADGKPGELLLLHVDASSRKLTLRSVAQGASAASALKPAELKFAPCVNNLVQLRCRFAFNVALPNTASSGQLRQELARLVDDACSRVSESIVLLGDSGDVPGSDTALLDVLPTAAAAATSVPVVQAQLLSPVGVATTLGSPAPSAPVQGRGRLRGACMGVAYCHKRQPYARATAELLYDLAASLRARLELLVEDALSVAEEAAEAAAGGDVTAGAAQHPLLREGPLTRPVVVGLPQRVLIPWVAGLSLCDYLVGGEDVPAALERATEMLGASPSGSTGGKVEAVEAEPTLTPAKKLPVWQPNAEPAKVVADVGGGPSSAGGAACSKGLMGGAAAVVAVGVAGLAVAMSYMTVN